MKIPLMFALLLAAIGAGAILTARAGDVPDEPAAVASACPPCSCAPNAAMQAAIAETREKIRAATADASAKE